MNAIVEFVLKHGYAVLFAAIFAHQMGLPIPGPLFLLAAGALARQTLQADARSDSPTRLERTEKGYRKC